ncbi:MAG: hypothetical protein M1837_003145 [Sclerophora amabilis]|nr:MAG: hypothetical protein M1837_003145 [Sclerophora amabilis]
MCELELPSLMHQSLSSNRPLDFLLPFAHQQYYQPYQHGASAPPPREALRAITNSAESAALPAASHLPVAPTRSGLHTPPLEMSGAPPHDTFLPSHHGSQPHNSINGGPNGTTAKPLHSTSSSVDVPHRHDPQFSLSSNSSQVPHHRPSHAHSRQGSLSRLDMSQQRKKGPTDNSIVPSLQIPPTINNSKGSLAEFAAQITCLFWFESSFTLHRVEKSKVSPSPTTPLVPEAIPTTGFRKWVTTILSTTQVTQNVILLALMFIHRLKKLNPTVKGKTGSEFRLLTVALMLGNKFLDDNTYTNKTWAEVSGISVQEIHIMEVEFLSNMRYGLFTSDAEWREWHVKLGRFWQYFDMASRVPVETSPRSLGPPPNPPLTLPSALPSPPASTHASPPFMPSHSPNHPAYLHPLSMPPHLPPTIPSPVAPIPEIDLRPAGRKRSYDENGQEPPQKRMFRPSISGPPPPPLSSSQSIPSNAAYTPGTGSTHMPRLPVPNLTISTAQPSLAGYHTQSSSTQLPPPGSKAMSMVFPPPTNWPTTSGSMNTSISGSGPPAAHNVSISPFGDQSRRQPSYPNHSSSSSPTSSMFPNQTQAPAPSSLSPSYFLTQRNSPYRPVRGVSTLLVPPPSGTTQRAPQSLAFDQMHYQPLGKPRNERRSGVVPYMPHDAWQNLPNPHFNG